MAHTPGPWHVGRAIHWPIEIFSEDQNSICYLDNSENTDSEDNAKLIAAAPELLDMLSKLVADAYCEKGYNCCCTYCDAKLSDDGLDITHEDGCLVLDAKKVITKAKGKDE